ncbi:MAG: fumarylacetoacetate hydrolase family protein [Gammaproteobacteria bacterium]
MTNDEHGQRAGQLFDQHRRGMRFTPFTGSATLPDLDAAYAVQEAFVRLLCAAEGTRVAGWKIGLTSPRMQALLGIDSPIAGAVLATRIQASGSTFSRAAFGRFGLECEIAVRLGGDLPAAGAPYDVAAVAAAVEAVCAAIEIVDDRAADYTVTDIGSLVADNSWNAGLVLGEFQTHWPDLAEVCGVVWRDGVEIDRGRGADVLGHPFVPLAWLANHLAARGQGLAAGDIVSTGSLAPTRFPEAPERCRFTVAGIGAVELTVT